jgi:hypothetical protein
MKQVLLVLVLVLSSAACPMEAHVTGNCPTGTSQESYQDRTVTDAGGDKASTDIATCKSGSEFWFRVSVWSPNGARLINKMVGIRYWICGRFAGQTRVAAASSIVGPITYKSCGPQADNGYLTTASTSLIPYSSPPINGSFYVSR